MNKTIDIQAAVAIAAAEAMAAKTQGTFGVGGVLLDGAGNGLQSMHNNVVRQGLVFDPTAHGEIGSAVSPVTASLAKSPGL